MEFCISSATTTRSRRRRRSWKVLRSRRLPPSASPIPIAIWQLKRLTTQAMNEDRSRSDRPVRTLTETDETRDPWYARALPRLAPKPRESIRYDPEDALDEAVREPDFPPQE